MACQTANSRFVGKAKVIQVGTERISIDNSACGYERIASVLDDCRKTDAERRQAIPYSKSTLLIRNLRDVFGENDPARRRAAIDETYTENCVFYDPSKGVFRGRDEIDRIAGAIKATHPEFRYQPITEPAESGNGGLVRWVSGRPGEAPAYAGTDFIIAQDGRIAAIYLFFDKLR
jgi:hypothetical protein